MWFYFAYILRNKLCVSGLVLVLILWKRVRNLVFYVSDSAFGILYDDNENLNINFYFPFV